MQYEEFACFPLLPPELRVVIWKFASHEIRELDVTLKRDADYNPTHFASTRPPPAILHTSHEAREEGLKYYKLAFDLDSAPPRIYFNIDADRVHFGASQDTVLHRKIKEMGIRRLAANVGSRRRDAVLCLPYVLDADHLEELVFYCSQHCFESAVTRGQTMELVNVELQEQSAVVHEKITIGLLYAMRRWRDDRAELAKSRGLLLKEDQNLEELKTTISAKAKFMELKISECLTKSEAHEAEKAVVEDA